MLLKLKLFTFILFVFYVQNMFGLNEGITYNLKLPSNCKGLIIVFPKLGASSENTDKETQIDDKAFLRGYGTIIFDYNRSFYLTLEDFNKVYRIVKKVVRGNNIPEDEIVIGGFSIGGNIALSYCIWVNKLQKKIKPKKIFVGDSPVELQILYEQKKEYLRKKKNIAKEEAELIVTFLGYYLGDPSVNKEKYVKYSPYIKEVGKASNVRFLRDYCINFYSEPDLFWYKTNLNFDYQDTNSYQIEMFVDELSSIGNENVNYVKTTAKGYVEGKRNPHSWSIIDPEDFMNWVENKKCLKR